MPQPWACEAGSRFLEKVYWTEVTEWDERGEFQAENTAKAWRQGQCPKGAPGPVPSVPTTSVTSWAMATPGPPCPGPKGTCCVIYWALP